MAFNPSTLDTRAAADAGAWLTLEDFDGNEIFDDEGKPVQFLLAGRDSAVAKEAFRQLQGKEGKALEGAALDALCKVVLGWSDNLTEEYTPENVRKVMQIPHIQEWAMAEVVKRANFSIKGSIKPRSTSKKRRG